MAPVLGRWFDRASGKSPLHMVSAWSSGTAAGVGAGADAQSIKITAVPKLLRILTLKASS